MNYRSRKRQNTYENLPDLTSVQQSKRHCTNPNSSLSSTETQNEGIPNDNVYESSNPSLL